MRKQQANRKIKTVINNTSSNKQKEKKTKNTTYLRRRLDNGSEHDVAVIGNSLFRDHLREVGGGPPLVGYAELLAELVDESGHGLKLREITRAQSKRKTIW